MDERVIKVDQYFSTEFCDSIISKAEALTFQQGTVGVDNDSLDVYEELRVCDVAWLNSPIKDFDVYFSMCKLAKEVNEEAYKFDLDFPESFQVAKYTGNKKSKHDIHADNFVTKPEDLVQRKLSMSLVLSDSSEYEGGNLEFYDGYPERNTIVSFSDLKKGTAIFFPSYLFHAVLPITKGTRYSLVGWFNGPRFK